MAKVEIPQQKKWVIWFVNATLGTFVRLYFRLCCEGQYDVFTNETRPIIVVFNHASNLDPVAVAICIGGAKIFHHIVTVAKKELFENPLTGWGVRGIGALPLDRAKLDTSAARTILTVLKAGKSVLIAPEGTRSRTGQINEFNPAFVKLAIKANALILPVGVRGAHEAFPRGAIFPRPKRITARMGEKIDLANYHGEDWRERDEIEVAAMIREVVINLTQESAT